MLGFASLLNMMLLFIPGCSLVLTVCLGEETKSILRAGHGQTGSAERKATGWCHQTGVGDDWASQPDGASGAGPQCYLALLCLELGVCPNSPYHWTWYIEFDKGGGPGDRGFDGRT